MEYRADNEGTVCVGTVNQSLVTLIDLRSSGDKGSGQSGNPDKPIGSNKTVKGSAGHAYLFYFILFCII